MILLLHFFIVYAPIIYLVLAVGVLFATRGLARSMREKEKAVFGLEREISLDHLRQSIALLGVVIFLAVGELILQAFVAPSLPAVTTLSTPTLGLLTVPTSTLPVLPALGTEAPATSATAEISDCIPGQIMINTPKQGDTISGAIVIIGTVDVPNFGHYTYEFVLSGANNWSPILAGREVVRDGEIGRWDTSQLTSGDYMLRLVVFDNQGNAIPACVVPVRISNQ
jgi:hypothetical protein